MLENKILLYSFTVKVQLGKLEKLCVTKIWKTLNKFLLASIYVTTQKLNNDHNKLLI